MDSKKHRDRTYTDKRFLNDLFDFFEDVEGLSDQEVKEELREAGIDADALIAKAELLVKMKLKEARLSWKNGALEKAAAFKERVGSATYDMAKNSSDAIEKIKELLARLPEGQRVAYGKFYRNLEEFSDEELVSIYEDLQQLEHSSAEAGKAKDEDR